MSRSFALSDSDVVQGLWRRQSGVCALCGQAMLRNRFEAASARLWSKDRATLDHVIPRSKGGRDGADNLQLAHALCNKIKGNRIAPTRTG